MTEDEAKTKRCCGPEGCGDSADSGSPYYDDIGRCCIGSKCMAWRWEMTPIRAAEVNARGDAKAKASGHCGLAK